jgi:single-strand DNA-binding protein
MTDTERSTQGERYGLNEANVVSLVGRVTAVPEERVLPSGDMIVTFRISVPRPDTPLSRRSKQSTDWVDCVASSARCRRTVGSWRVGDRVVVQGALRRRFYRTGAGASTRLEVEALRTRRVSRAAAGTG